MTLKSNPVASNIDLTSLFDFPKPVSIHACGGLNKNGSRRLSSGT